MVKDAVPPPPPQQKKKLAPGYEIQCRKGPRYAIYGQVGNNVYIVENRSTRQMYGMKLEFHSEHDPSAQRELRNEVLVLLDAARHPKRFSRHFLRIHSKGRVEGQLNWLMTDLCDFNLNDLRKYTLEGYDFSKATAARLCMQTFQAVHDLHSIGYIHRKISPTKFVFSTNDYIVYMIGFAMAHQFEQHYDNKMPKRTSKMPKMAKRSFLPRAYHKNKELYRKDDLEAWVYLCFDMFGRRILPWDEKYTDLNMFVNKERFFCHGYPDVYKYVPTQFQTIITHLDKLADDARPDYTFIGMMLVTMKETIRFKYKGPFEWQKARKDAEGQTVSEAEEKLELDDAQAALHRANKAGKGGKVADFDDEEGGEEGGAPGKDAPKRPKLHPIHMPGQPLHIRLTQARAGKLKVEAGTLKKTPQELETERKEAEARREAETNRDNLKKDADIKKELGVADDGPKKAQKEEKEESGKKAAKEGAEIHAGMSNEEMLLKLQQLIERQERLRAQSLMSPVSMNKSALGGNMARGKSMAGGVSPAAAGGFSGNAGASPGAANGIEGSGCDGAAGMMADGGSPAAAAASGGAGASKMGAAAAGASKMGAATVNPAVLTMAPGPPAPLKTNLPPPVSVRADYGFGGAAAGGVTSFRADQPITPVNTAQSSTPKMSHNTGGVINTKGGAANTSGTNNKGGNQPMVDPKAGSVAFADPRFPPARNASMYF